MDAKNLATVEKMWQREVEAAATYRHLANRERDAKRRDILLRLADQEARHATRWSERIAAATGRVPDPATVERGLSWFQRISDPNVVLHRLEQEENKAEAEYDQLLARLTDPADREIANDAMLEERDHAVILRTLAGGKIPTARSTLDMILGRERWHVRGSGWIGDAIYGVNDGLGAVFGIVSGMAGYTGGSEVVLAAGLAGTLASALSMGAGAYLSSKSQREVYESEVSREQAEIEEDPHEEMLELELFYQLKGFSPEESRAMAERLQKEPRQFLRTLVHEELGLSRKRFRTRGDPQYPRPYPRPLAASSRSSRSSSRSACRRSSPRSSSARSRTSSSAPPRRWSRPAPGGRAVSR
jgi:VIT1/CCC1 family predicted Fe2+/Mn2+ transporter/rubrerythrin